MYRRNDHNVSVMVGYTTMIKRRDEVEDIILSVIALGVFVIIGIIVIFMMEVLL